MNFELIRGCYLAFIFCLLLIVLPLNASASTIVNIDDDYFGFGNVKISYNGSDFYENGTGMLQVNYNNYNTWAFCIDLDYIVAFGDNDIEDTIDIADNYLYVEWLVDTYANDLFVAANSAGAGSVPDAISYKSAALQLAIWEALYDGTGTPTTNIFSFDITQSQILTNEYNAYMLALNDAVYDQTNPWDNSVIEGEYIVLELSQDNGATNTQNIIVNVVPEPTTALLLGFGLLGLCGVGRKRV